jgi:hypothetical protein
MAIRIKRTTNGGAPTGLQEGQLAIEMNNGGLWVGVPVGIDPNERRRITIPRLPPPTENPGEGSILRYRTGGPMAPADFARWHYEALPPPEIRPLPYNLPGIAGWDLNEPPCTTPGIYMGTTHTGGWVVSQESAVNFPPGFRRFDGPAGIGFLVPFILTVEGGSVEGTQWGDSAVKQTITALTIENVLGGSTAGARGRGETLYRIRRGADNWGAWVQLGDTQMQPGAFLRTFPDMTLIYKTGVTGQWGWMPSFTRFMYHWELPDNADVTTAGTVGFFTFYAPANFPESAVSSAGGQTGAHYLRWNLLSSQPPDSPHGAGARNPTSGPLLAIDDLKGDIHIRTQNTDHTWRPWKNTSAVLSDTEFRPSVNLIVDEAPVGVTMFYGPGGPTTGGIPGPPDIYRPAAPPSGHYLVFKTIGGGSAALCVDSEGNFWTKANASADWIIVSPQRVNMLVGLRDAPINYNDWLPSLNSLQNYLAYQNPSTITGAAPLGTAADPQWVGYLNWGGASGPNSGFAARIQLATDQHGRIATRGKGSGNPVAAPWGPWNVIDGRKLRPHEWPANPHADPMPAGGTEVAFGDNTFGRRYTGNFNLATGPTVHYLAGSGMSGDTGLGWGGATLRAWGGIVETSGAPSPTGTTYALPSPYAYMSYSGSPGGTSLAFGVLDPPSGRWQNYDVWLIYNR